MSVLLGNKDCIIANFIKKNKSYFKNLTKSQKIYNIRKKHSALRHEYYTMANKYSDMDKIMLSFTVPSTVKGKTIKNGRYAKLRELIKIRAYIAKSFNNVNIKYFMNIELGKAYSNPHIHIQIWYDKEDTSATTLQNIYNKTIQKFNLTKSRCKITLPEKAIGVYHYVIKDYAKDLTDKQLWDLETQKKRMRKQLGSRVRFYSKSSDRFTKRIYRIMYFSYGVIRSKVDEFIEFLLDKFFYFNKNNFVVFSDCLFLCFSKLGYIEQGEFSLEELIMQVVACCRDPPCLAVVCFSLKFKEVDMERCFEIYYLEFIMVVEFRCRSPPLQWTRFRKFLIFDLLIRLFV